MVHIKTINNKNVENRETKVHKKTKIDKNKLQ